MSELKHLITAEEIPDRTVAQPNADLHKLSLAIPLAERKHLKKLLGPALFAELLLSVQTATTDDEPLARLANLDELKDMLCQWALVEAWPNLQVHVAEAGIVVKNGKEVSTSADEKLAQKTLDSHISTANFYSSELTAWMVEHKADYPSYAPPLAAALSTMPVGGIDLD
ncbi:hypothetical protein [Hymenobacter sp. YC55]|uniref:DUF6712 family protein n=1 Tax=Hymenobacter sp. YC55 TaxID=3034019 RepID=UPI0023F93759|nr:hypothetical protein [Hymenobacter sp. YC55]MDF7810750.1 hypothetical protein [Hymenobacter sp. YC55]